MNYNIHTDGGSRGNPGKAGVGVVIENESGPVISFGKTIGIATNNVAEYTAVIEALTWILDNKKGDTKSIKFYLDSTLVVNQLNGTFKVKDANMRMLMLKVRELEQMVGGYISYMYVPRAENAAADFQVNKALDTI